MLCSSDDEGMCLCLWWLTLVAFISFPAPHVPIRTNHHHVSPARLPTLERSKNCQAAVTLRLLRRRRKANTLHGAFLQPPLLSRHVRHANATRRLPASQQGNRFGAETTACAGIPALRGLGPRPGPLPAATLALPFHGRDPISGLCVYSSPNQDSALRS